MSHYFLALLLLILGVFLWGIAFGGRLPDRYRNRSCQGSAWRRQFPGAPKTEIREFLSIFVSAFGFTDGEKLKLNPDDSIHHIYRAVNPYKECPDALELERLAMEVQEKYGVDLPSLLDEHLTLGELFSHVRRIKAP